MRSVLFNGCVWVLTACGAFLFTSGGLDYWESRSAQNEIASRWTNALQTGPARSEPNTPSGHHGLQSKRTASVGAAVARLTIPRLDAALYVVEGTDDRDLKRGPGHLTGTAYPGEVGNCVIAGHRDTHFRVLQNLHRGDEIDLERDGYTFRYRVDGMEVVTPDNTESLQPSGKPVLNLITCYPFHYIGSAPKRFIVHADLEKSVLTASR